MSQKISIAFLRLSNELLNEDKTPEEIFNLLKVGGLRVTLKHFKRVCNRLRTNTNESNMIYLGYVKSDSVEKIIGRPTKMKRDEMSLLLAMLKDKNNYQMKQLTDSFNALCYGNIQVGHVSKTVIHRAIRKLGWTRKKFTRRHRLKNYGKILSFMESIAHVNPSRLVDMDGMIQTPKDFEEDYGYAPRNEECYKTQILIGTKSYAVMAAYTERGWICWEIYTGTVTNVEVANFVNGRLAEVINPGEGGSYLMLDNAKNQRHANSRASMERVFAGYYMFRPPFSPEYGPVENGFANIKKELKKHENDGAIDPIGTINAAFSLYSVIGEKGNDG